MIQILFVLLSLSLVSPGFAAETSAGMVLIPAGKSHKGSNKSLLELRPHDLVNTYRHTLCPEDPAHEIDLDGIAIVISPLIALMKNQVDLIRGNNSDESIAHVLNSSLNILF